MKRIRTVFVLLALVLLASLALLVDRAHDSVAAERAMRHRAVAERIVDEMERELTAWLRREEDRPFGHYRYFFVPEGSPPQLINLTRSPLSQPPDEPFVVCYFQIDPDGAVSSPLWPDNEALAAAVGGWRASPEVREFVDLIGEAVRDFWTTEAAAQERDIEPGRWAGDRAKAGETVALERPKAKNLPAALEQKAAEADDGASPLDYFSDLNRGARARSQRPTKVEPSQAANVYNFLQKEANVLQSAVQSQAESLADADRRAGELLATPGEVERDIAEVLETGAATIDVRLQPMVGRLATPGHLALYRTVSIAEEAYVQGLVLDVPALLAWVAERTLADADLAERARVEPASDARSYPPEVYTYRHRFAEPFGAVAADVSLEPLPESAGLLNLTNLSLLLAFAASFGLLALYRMVAVAVTFAERRNNFVSAVTHELKTPLTAIRMYGEMLRDGVVPEEGKRQRYYEIMTAETERLTRLVQNVLELSRLEQKKRAVTMVAGDVVGVVEEVLGVLSPHAERQGFALRLDAEPDLPQVRYDRDALVQVLFNLVDNALKYARDARDKEIVVRCRRRGERVAVTVADRGPGVTRPQLKKIFEPFYRAEDELTRTSKGTGIGLALVRGLVETMGGTVTGKNADGGGFEVEVRLAAAGS